MSGRIDDLDSALNAVEMNSDSLESVALRSEAAQELIDAASRRIEKVTVDLNLGVNLTAAGVAWIPAFGITGLGLFPIVSVRIKPEELKELETSRRTGESAMYAGLSRNLQSQLAMQFFTAYNGYRSAKEALAIYEGEILPELRRAAQGGSASALRELAEAEAQFAGLKGEQGQTLSLLNHLLGRPGDHLIMDELAMERALEQLKARFTQDSPLDSKLSVLKSRVETARAVETIVDKNLKLQELRAEPVSLIGRSIGRLIDALSGSGDPSPELMAMARHQTLEAESELRAFERSLPALRARIRFELARTERGLKELEGKLDGRSRLAAAALRRRLYDLKAQGEFYGVEEGNAGQGSSASLPGSYDELESRLAAAFQEETPITGLGAAGTPEGEGTEPIAKGFPLRPAHSGQGSSAGLTEVGSGGSTADHPPRRPRPGRDPAGESRSDPESHLEPGPRRVGHARRPPAHERQPPALGAQELQGRGLPRRAGDRGSQGPLRGGRAPGGR